VIHVSVVAKPDAHQTDCFVLGCGTRAAGKQQWKQVVDHLPSACQKQPTLLVERPMKPVVVWKSTVQLSTTDELFAVAITLKQELGNGTENETLMPDGVKVANPHCIISPPGRVIYPF